jgi:hypothetical protein
MKYKNSKIAFLALISLSIAHPCLAGALDDLNSDDREKVLATLNGEQKPVSVRVSIDGAIWPEFKVFEKINASPEEAMAVFADAKNHRVYFTAEGITQSDVVSGAGTSTIQIAYHLTEPMASDDYVCVDHLSSDPATGSYLVKWDVTQSNASYAKSPNTKVWSNGSAKFEPYEGGTLIVYSNLVAPKERLGVSWGWVINQAEGLVENTVDALTKQIQNEKESDPTTLSQQIESLKTALAH